MANQQITRHDAAVSDARLVPDAAKEKLRQFWQANSKHIASVTAGKDVDRILKVTYSVIYRNPKLISCSPFSLLNGIVLAHQMGLVLGTPEVSLVPFGSEATLIIGYQGKVKLALASRLITAIHTDVVMAGEDFKFEMTERGPKFFHRPDWANRVRPDDANVAGAYCQLKTANGGSQTTFVPLWEILDARGRSRGYKYQAAKSGSDNPWITDFGAMAKKTAVHRAMKLAPQDARMSIAGAIDEEELGGKAVIAEGLDPSAFTDADLNAPLVETGADAAQSVAQQKIETGKIKAHRQDPNRTYSSFEAMAECGETGKYEQIWIGGVEYKMNETGGYNKVEGGIVEPRT